MDPQAALDAFNDPSTSRASRADLAQGLLTWLERGGFRPTGTLAPHRIAAMQNHNDHAGAGAALLVNDLLETRQA